MSGLLASVCSLAEAEMALQAQVDIIDCKNPRDGALGALSLDEITQIVTRVNGRRPVSATTGNLSANAEELRQAIQQTAACGVDYIKFGLFAANDVARFIPHLRNLSTEHKLIAVCFADRFDPNSLMSLLAEAGCHGVMIDTADKHSGSLTELWSRQRLGDFVKQARQLGLLCGLAGKLQLADISRLLPLKADYLGFRTALCAGDRRQSLDQTALARVRRALPIDSDCASARQTVPA